MTYLTRCANIFSLRESSDRIDTRRAMESTPQRVDEAARQSSDAISTFPERKNIRTSRYLSILFKDYLAYLCSFCFLTSSLYADFLDHTTPWTPTYLMTQSDFAIDRFSAHTRRRRQRSPRYQARYSLSSAPFVDWGMQMSLMTSSIKTPKLTLRVEKQLLCDLSGDAIAMTGLCFGTITTLDRAKNPTFFEMATKSLEIGFGLGRHLWNEKAYYTQLFSYLMAGLGSRGARFETAEIGIKHVYNKHHHIVASIEYVHTHPIIQHQTGGIANQKGQAISFGALYSYHFDSGIEASIGYLKRKVHSKLLKSATVVYLQLSLPMAL